MKGGEVAPQLVRRDAIEPSVFRPQTMRLVVVSAFLDLCKIVKKPFGQLANIRSALVCLRKQTTHIVSDRFTTVPREPVLVLEHLDDVREVVWVDVSPTRLGLAGCGAK